MPDLRRTAQAEEDLIDLWLYIAPDNPGAADRLLDEIEDKCILLAANGEPIPTLPSQAFCTGISMVMCLARSHTRVAIFDAPEFADGIRPFCYSI